MSEPTPDRIEERLLLLAPTANDVQEAHSVLTRAGFAVRACRDLAAVCDELGRGAGAVIIAEEAIDPRDIATFVEQVKTQPPWSDVPIVVITGHGQLSRDTNRLFELFEQGANVSLLERPFRINTLLSLLRTALRSRRRQYEVRDLLEQVQEANAELEQRVAHRTAQLNSSVKSLESFCYSLSHDLRAPLRAIRTFTKVIENDYEEGLQEEVRGLLRRVSAAGERMDTLINDLLSLSIVSQSEVPLITVNVDRVTNDAVETLRSEITKTGARVEIPALQGKVHANPVILRQVIENFLSNALKYTKEGEPPFVRIHSEVNQDRIRILVEDRGIGIPHQYQERIFGLFQRLHGAAYPGTGVGLAIAKVGAQRMLGDVGVISENGAGSTFWVELPAARAE